MRALRSSRRRALAFAAIVSTVLTFGIDVLAFAAETDDHGEPGLHSLGFLQRDELTLANGQRPPDFANMRFVGSVQPRTALLLDELDHSLMSISAAELRQTSVMTMPQTIGTVRSFATDPAHSMLYLGTAVRVGAVDTCNTPLVCMAGPLAEAPQLVAVNPVAKTSKVYSFPAEFNATSVVGLTTATTTAGASVVYALLYNNISWYSGYPGAAAHSLQLVALDPGQLAKADPSAAVLWSYSIPSCASLPGTTTSDSQDFLGVTAAGDAAYFVCRGRGAKNGVAAEVPAGAVVIDFGQPHPTASAGSEGFRTSYYPQGAGADFSISGGDGTRGLLFLTSVASINKQYVFNVAHRAWTGSVPFPSAGDPNLWGTAVDASTGRDYVVYGRDFVVAVQDDQLPVPQGTKLALGDLIPASVNAFVEPSTHTLLMVGTFKRRDGSQYARANAIAMFRDVRPIPPVDAPDDPDALTHDAPITPQTPVSYAAFASGYGAKAILVGGARATTLGRLNGLGPGYFLGQICDNSPDPRGCFASPNPSDGSRTVSLGVVDGVEVSNAATKASAASAELDGGTEADLAAAGHFRPSDDVWNKFGPGGEAPATPGAGDAVTAMHEQLAPAECADLNGSNPPAVSSNGAQAACHGGGQQQASAGAVGPEAAADSPVKIGYAAASTAVGRINDIPVTVAKAEAQGVRLTIPGGPTVDIGRVTTTATTAAAGRTGSATSKFTRQISNVAVRDPSGAVVFGCGFSGANGSNAAECDPGALTDAVSAQSPSPVLFRLPQPDARPSVVGSPGGAQASVIKDPYSYWNDYFTNADPSYEIPGLQIILVGDQTQPSRLVINLAGVHAESHQVIGVEPPAAEELGPPSLELLLTDDATPPAPLAGAAFVLTGPEGTTPLACLTGADGIGTCTFPALPPGSYTIQEKTAPPGYAAVDEYEVLLEAGNDYKTSFVNLPAIGSVELTLSSPDVGDKDGGPLEGGVFALVKADALDTPLATCTTDTEGACGFEEVPLGDYAMQQVTAPEGFLTSDAVDFSLTKPREIARLAFVDGIPGVKAVPPIVIPGKPPVPPTIIPGKPAVPPKVIPGKPPVPPRTMVLPALEGTGQAGLDMEPVGYESDANAPVVASSPSDAMAPLELGAGGLGAVPARLAGLILHSPPQAGRRRVMWVGLGMPVYLWVRRSQFLTATEGF
jgi:hypothetical protein